MKQRDLLLVPFPFSDQKGKKVRPVIVISSDKFNLNSEDLLVVGVTSNISKHKYSLNLIDIDLEEGELYSKCSIKCESILKIDKEIILKKIGKINKKTFELIKNKILELIN
jgi:mRNA interferase MazF